MNRAGTIDWDGRTAKKQFFLKQVPNTKGGDAEGKSLLWLILLPVACSDIIGHASSTAIYDKVCLAVHYIWRGVQGYCFVSFA